MKSNPTAPPGLAAFADEWDQDHINEVKGCIEKDKDVFNMSPASKAEWDHFFANLPMKPEDVPVPDRPVWNMELKNAAGVRAEERITYSPETMERLRLSLVESHKSDSDYIGHENFRGLARANAVRQLEEEAIAAVDFEYVPGQFLIYQQLWQPPGHERIGLFLSLGKIISFQGARGERTFELEFYAKSGHGPVATKWDLDAAAAYKPFYSEGHRAVLRETVSIANVISVGHSLTKAGKFTQRRPNKSRLTSLEVAGRDIATWLEKREHSRLGFLRAQAQEGPRG